MPACRLLLFAVFLICSLDVRPVRGQDDYPVRPLKVVVPFAPGGGSDTFVRVVLSVIESENLFPQPIVVINVPGAGGTIGSRRVLNVDPDGYTILNLHDGIMSAYLAGQTDYGPEAFRPIAATGRTSSMLCVRTDAPWQDLRELMDDAIARSGEIRFGANLGALSHFDAMRVEKAVPGAEFRYVPTGGGAKRFADLIGDHIDATVFNIAEYDQFREAGVKAVAIFSEQRHDDFPDVPTAKECGVNVVRDSMQYWWAPRETADMVVDRLTSLLRTAMATPALKKRLAELKMEPVFLTGRELDAFLSRQQIAMSTVGKARPLSLPNTPLLIVGATLVLGFVLLFRRMTGTANEHSALEITTKPASVTWKNPACGTLLLLVLFCLLFATSMAPFWLLAFVFVVATGALLLEWSRRNLIALLLVAAVAGPGCFLLFTKLLTIDLS